MLILRVSSPTPGLRSITVIRRHKGREVARGYLQPTAEEWDGEDWAPLRALYKVETVDPSPEPRAS